MIIRTIDDVTRSVLDGLERAPNPRLNRIVDVVVRHLHAIVREAQLTEREFQDACAYIAALGKASSASHNEVVLLAGSLGVSSLVCMQNNGTQGTAETTANLLGPFWRPGSPRMENGASIVRSPSTGAAVLVSARIEDREGRPVAGAEVDVWHASTEGFYDNQDPLQADMNLRGSFISDAEGRVWFRTVKPAGYPIPVDGPVGDLLRSLGRDHLRPAHLHFLIFKPGFKTQFSQVYSSDDPHLHSDVQHGVTRALIGDYVRHDEAPVPACGIEPPWYSLEHRFVIERGEASLPRPPITGRMRESAPSAPQAGGPAARETRG